MLELCAEKCGYSNDLSAEKCIITMQRIILQEFIEWKKRPDRKPLIVNGARQVGKTWLLREFARTEYTKEAYIVCRKNDIIRQIFTQDFDVNRILRALRALSGVDITPGDTLIVLDEVQDVSLLGISLHNGVSYPVGKVNEIYVYPMNFEEFVLAKGESEVFKLIVNRDYMTMNLIHEKMVDLLRQYYYVGGMPEAVKKYVESDSLIEVRRIQNEILNGYELDLSKHAPKEQVPRIRMVWKSIPSQLFKDNKKFIYGALKKGARANDFEIAIQWLVDSGLVYKVPKCTKPALPLDVYEDLSCFKLYMLDVGLLGAMVNTEPVQVLINNNVFVEYKGGMTEQYVLQQMKSHGVSPVYYHKTDDSRLELDFVIQHNAKLLPVEVKAEGNVRANSLTALLAKNPDMEAVRFSMQPYKEQGQLKCVPLYAV